jgi:hypothetical protein
VRSEPRCRCTSVAVAGRPVPRRAELLARDPADLDRGVQLGPASTCGIHSMAIAEPVDRDHRKRSMAITENGPSRSVVRPVQAQIPDRSPGDQRVPAGLTPM